jgi:hypothetical protein
MIRRPVPWPGGAKVAVAITFDMDADSLVHVQHPRDSITSLMGDDVPCLLSTPKGELVELPVSWATDDWPPYVHSIDLDYMFQILPPERAMEVFMAEFEAARTVGGAL